MEYQNYIRSAHLWKRHTIVMDFQFFNTLYINRFGTGPLHTVTAVILTILDSNSQRYSSSKSTPSYHPCRKSWPPCMVDMRVVDCAGYHLGVSDSPSCWYRCLKVVTNEKWEASGTVLNKRFWLGAWCWMFSWHFNGLPSCFKRNWFYRE